MSESYWQCVIAAERRGHWDAQRLTDRAEVEECRRILGQPEPSWWAVAREHIERFNAEHPIDEPAALP